MPFMVFLRVVTEQSLFIMFTIVLVSLLLLALQASVLEQPIGVFPVHSSISLVFHCVTFQLLPLPSCYLIHLTDVSFLNPLLLNPFSFFPPRVIILSSFTLPLAIVSSFCALLRLSSTIPPIPV